MVMYTVQVAISANVYSIIIQYYSSAPCAMHTRTDCPMQHYTEVKDWSDMRYNRNSSAISGNQLWGSGQDKTQGTQAQPYKLDTLQESALPHLLYSLPYSSIAASLIQDQCHLPVISCSPELSLQITHEPNQHFPLLPPTLAPQQEMLLICIYTVQVAHSFPTELYIHMVVLLHLVLAIHVWCLMYGYGMLMHEVVVFQCHSLLENLPFGWFFQLVCHLYAGAVIVQMLVRICTSCVEWATLCYFI